MQILVNTALESVEKREEVKIDMDKIKFLKMPYKGKPHPAIVREKKKNSKVSLQ